MNNQAMKDYVDAVVDGVELGKSLIKNKGFAFEELPLIQKFVMDIPKCVQEYGQMIDQGKSLDPADEADLIAYIAAKFGSDNEKAKNILTKALAAAFANYRLVKAIQA